MLFFKKRNASASPAGTQSYDKARLEPVIRCSICTGEQVAGFMNRESGAFTETMLIRNAADLQAFRREYGIPEDEELRRFY